MRWWRTCPRTTSGSPPRSGAAGHDIHIPATFFGDYNPATADAFDDRYLLMGAQPYEVIRAAVDAVVG